MPTWEDPSNIGKLFISGYNSGNEAKMRNLQAQELQNKLDQEAQMKQATSQYGAMQQNLSQGTAFDQQGLPQAYQATMNAQGLGNQGQQVVNQSQQLQRANPQRQAIESGAMYLATLPDKQVIPAYKALKEHAASQGMDVSTMPDETQYKDKSQLMGALMSTLDPSFGEKYMQYKMIADSRMQAAQAKTANVNINGLTAQENEALNQAITNGLDPYKVNSKTAKIYAQQELANPGRPWNALAAQSSFERSPATSNTKALLSTIDPLLDKLDQSGKQLGNMQSPTANKVVNWYKENVSGDPNLTAFRNLRDDTVAEIERGLMNTGVLSDSKYNRAIKNVSEAANYQQLQAAIANTRTVIHARLESLNTGPYPNARAQSQQGVATQSAQGGGMTESAARSALSQKGITGTDQDAWIAKYRQAGKVQ